MRVTQSSKYTEEPVALKIKKLITLHKIIED